MAIIIEEEKTSAGIISFLGWASIAAILLAAAYYVFLVTPPVTVVIPPASLQNILSVSSANLNPENLLSSPSFMVLKQHVQAPVPTGPGNVGRSNPFVGL